MTLGLCTVSGKLVDAAGAPLEDAVVRYQLENPPKVVDGNTTGVSWEGGQCVSDRTGTFSFRVVQGVQLRVLIESIQYNRVVSVPAATTATLFNL
jgi:hypothetical protein